MYHCSSTLYRVLLSSENIPIRKLPCGMYVYDAHQLDLYDIEEVEGEQS